MKAMKCKNYKIESVFISSVKDYEPQQHRWYSSSYGLDNSGWSSSSVRIKNFEFSLLYIIQTGSGAQLPPIKWRWGGRSRGVKMTIHFQLVPKSIKYESINPFLLYVFIA
jgi:hypothetical protein